MRELMETRFWRCSPVTGKSLAETAETPCKYFARGTLRATPYDEIRQGRQDEKSLKPFLLEPPPQNGRRSTRGARGPGPVGAGGRSKASRPGHWKDSPARPGRRGCRAM